MSVHDYDIQSRLQELVEKATSRRHMTLEPALWQNIKAVCRDSDKNVHAVFECIYDRLRQPHSQVRLLALLLCAELFQRSRAFRALLSAKFTHVLELTVGFRLDNPLPPPASAATALRERALELVERWSADHGARYRQVAFGYAYLKDTLRLQFPETDARRAAAASRDAARQERAQRAAQERYARLLEEWPQQAAECQSVLHQVAEAFAIVEEEHAARGPAACALRAQAATAADDGWEDVETGQLGEKESEGLAAYAADAEPAACGRGSAGVALGGAAPPAAETAARHSDAVVETLAGLHRLLVSREIPAVQAALRTLARVEVGAPGEAQHAQRERLLRAATELKAELTAAEQRYASAQLDLSALVQAQQRRMAARSDAERTGALFGSDSDGDVAGGWGATASGALLPSGNIGRSGAAPTRPSMRDPAAPRQRPQGPPKGEGAAPAAASRSQPAVSRRSSQLSDQVRQALAAQAPVLPAGPYITAWDSGTTPRYVSAHGLEVSNHWGPVDVHQELPVERTDELFMVSTAVRGGTSQAQQRQQPASSVPIVAPGRAAGRASALRRDGDAAQEAVPVSERHVEAFATDERGRRTAERAYNEAVIGGAVPDEQLARALQDGESTVGGISAGKQKRRASLPPVRERLQKKLLGGRAVAAALQDASRAGQDRQRERFSNLWNNK